MLFAHKQFYELSFPEDVGIVCRAFGMFDGKRKVYFEKGFLTWNHLGRIWKSFYFYLTFSGHPQLHKKINVGP